MAKCLLWDDALWKISLDYNIWDEICTALKKAENDGNGNSQQTFIVFQDVLKTSWRRLQCNTFRLPRPLEDVFKTYLQYVFLKRLQDVFKTCLQNVLQLCLQDVLEDKKMLHCRRLQYVFIKTNVCWVITAKLFSIRLWIFSDHRQILLVILGKFNRIN